MAVEPRDDYQLSCADDACCNLGPRAGESRPAWVSRLKARFEAFPPTGKRLGPPTLATRQVEPVRTVVPCARCGQPRVTGLPCGVCQQERSLR